MALNFTTTAHIKRAWQAFFNKNANWTKTFYVRLGTTTPGGGQFRWYWQLGTGAGNLYLYCGSQAASNNIYLEVGDNGAFPATAPFNLSARTWYFIAVQYTASTTTLEIFVDNVSKGTIVFDLSTLTFSDDEYHSETSNFNDFAVANERLWQRKLSAAELVIEKAAFRAILQTNLLSDSPLPNDTYLTDYEGAHNWSPFGTRGYKPGAIVPNNSLANAFDIGTTLPYSYPQDTNLADAGADTYNTIPVYYKFSSNFNGPLGVFGFGDLTTFQPRAEIYSPDISTIYFGLQTGATYRNRPVWFPVVNGQDYWFAHFLTGGTDVDNAVLLLDVVTNTDTLVAAGDFITTFEINGAGNDYEWPLMLRKGDTNYQIRKFVQMVSPLGGARGSTGLPHGIHGQILENGNFMLSDDVFLNVKIYDSNYNLVTTINDYVTSTAIVAVGISKVLQKFYNAHKVGGNPFKLDKRSSTGALEQSWTLTAITTLDFIAVNAAGTILYFSQGGSSAIKRWDLVNDIALSDLVADTAGYRIENLMVLEDDTILALHLEEATTPRDVKVIRYSTAGVVLNTYSFGDSWRSEVSPPRIGFALAADSPENFFIYLKPEASPELTYYRKIRVSDGVQISEVIHINYHFGFYLGAEIASPLGRFGSDCGIPLMLAQAASTARNANSGLYLLTGAVNSSGLPVPISRHDTLVDASGVEQNVAIPIPFWENYLAPGENDG